MYNVFLFKFPCSCFQPSLIYIIKTLWGLDQKAEFVACYLQDNLFSKV